MLMKFYGDSKRLFMLKFVRLMLNGNQFYSR